MSSIDDRLKHVFGADALPPDEVEFSSVAPDGAPHDGSGGTPGLPLESAARPDLEPGVVEADRAFAGAAEPSFAAAMFMHTSLDGLHLIEGFEGFSPVRYLDSVGVPTIGYGTTSADIFPLPTGCTRRQAEGWLSSHLASKYEPAVRSLGVPLSQHQFDALVSFAYNLGPGSMSAAWTIGRLLRARDYRGAADSMLLYDHAGGRVLAGLLHRRQSERSLFLEPMPAEPDPHHLQRFPNATFVIDGQRINERDTVAEFYRLLAHRAQSENQLRHLQGELVLLRKRVWAVAHFSDPPSWGADWRGWRWQTLNHLTAVPI